MNWFPLSLFLLCLVFAACDVTLPEAPLSEPEREPSSNTGTIDIPAGSNLIWAFPPEMEQSRIVYTHFDTDNLQWNLHKINADGSGAVPFDIPRDNGVDPPDIVFHALRWRPDGRQLVYRGSNTNTDNWYLVLVDSSGTWRRRLTDIGGFASDPSWSPRGDRLLYGRGGFFGGQFGTIIQTTLVDTLGNSTNFFIEEESRLFEGDSVFYALFDEGTNAVYDAEWAPDGEHLYMVGFLDKRPDAGDLAAEDVELFKVAVGTGRVVERLTHNAIDERGFILSPDGTRALLAQGAGSALRIYLMDLSGSVALPLTDEPHENPPRWAIDSRHILYEKQGGIYLLDVEQPEQERRITDGFHADIFTQGVVNTGIERR